MRTLSAFLVLLGGCVWHGPAPKGTERGMLPGVSGMALPTCVTGYPDRLDLWDAEGYWSSVVPGAFNCTRNRSSVEIVAEDIQPEKGLDGAIGYAHYELNGYGQIDYCRVTLSPAWQRAWELILRHEIGHCFGLADDTGTGYLMDGYLHPTARELSPEDLELLTP